MVLLLRSGLDDENRAELQMMLKAVAAARAQPLSKLPTLMLLNDREPVRRAQRVWQTTELLFLTGGRATGTVCSSRCVGEYWQP